MTLAIKGSCTLRRDARSGVQLSCTETRFKKCFHSGKDGSKHAMFSISVAYNVISCKKESKETLRNKKRWFYDINSASNLINYQKSPKKRITQSRFAQFFVEVWYILASTKWVKPSQFPPFHLLLKVDAPPYFPSGVGVNEAIYLDVLKSFSSKKSEMHLGQFCG